MESQDLLVGRLIADEFDEIVLVIDKNDRVIIANEYARRRLELPEPCPPAVLRARFGAADVYGYIAGLTFNYHWQGCLTLVTGAGTKARMQCRTKFICGQKCVFHDLLIIGNLDEQAEKIHNTPAGNWNVDQSQFRKLCEISATINSNLHFQSICEEITMKAAELIGADRSLLYSVNNMQIGVFAAWNMTEYEKSLFRLVDMEHGVIKNCLRNMAPVLVPVYSRHPDWIPEIYEALQFESFILYPLLAQKQLVGVLALFGREPLKFDDKDLMLLQMISNQMAIAVLNAQVYSEIRSLNKHLEEEVCLKVNELRISELQLIRKNNELEAIFHSITDSLVVVDDKLRILDINAAARSYYAIGDNQQALGKKYCDVFCSQMTCQKRKNNPQSCAKYGERCPECYLHAILATGRPTVTEIDSGHRVYMISAYPISDETGKVIKAICFLRDITLTKRKSEELIQYQKMQAVGQLAAGVAHEIRNPLGAISNYVYILENWLTELESNKVAVDADIKDTFGAIKRLVERSENVISNLLGFSRSKSNEITTFRFYNAIEQILLLVGKTAQRNKVGINVQGPPELAVKTDSNALQHILFNLIINAIDALPDGGTIGVNYQLDEECLEFKVVDNGIGMSPEEIEKIYNPFYTTKAPDRGTGLGLYVVYNLVEQLHGSIAVDSKVGAGTVFTVRIPQYRLKEDDNEKHTNFACRGRR